MLLLTCNYRTSINALPLVSMVEKLDLFFGDYLTCKWLSCLHKGEHWRFRGSEAVPSVVTIHQSLIIEDVRKTNAVAYEIIKQMLKPISLQREIPQH